MTSLRSASLLMISVALLVLTGCAGPAPATSPVNGAQPAPAPAATRPAAGSSTPSDPTPAPSGAVILRADWSAGLDGWSGSEDWTALRGELLSAGRIYRLEAGAVAPIDVDQAGDFAVEAEIRLLRYAISNGSFGVMVRVQEDGSGYGMGHDGADDLVVLMSQPGRDMLDRQPFTPGDGYHRYRIEVRGNELSAFIDGAPVAGATDNTFLTGKRVGLWSNGAQLSVRSFEVTEI